MLWSGLFADRLQRLDSFDCKPRPKRGTRVDHRGRACTRYIVGHPVASRGVASNLDFQPQHIPTGSYNRLPSQGHAYAMCETGCTQIDGWRCVGVPAHNKLERQGSTSKNACSYFAAVSLWIWRHALVVNVELPVHEISLIWWGDRAASCCLTPLVLLFHHVRRWQNVLSPFFFGNLSLVDSTFEPGVQPTFVYHQNWVTWSARTCVCVETTERERERELGKYCATASDSEVNSLKTNMGDCRNTNMSIFWFFSCIALLNTYILQPSLSYGRKNHRPTTNRQNLRWCSPTGTMIQVFSSSNDTISRAAHAALTGSDS